ncbi:MAG: hypothetical protein KGZ97_01475 [Bacteroidetes bacterium]|nr:hypothetical protein [Bacteroidota bacterium]
MKNQKKYMLNLFRHIGLIAIIITLAISSVIVYAQHEHSKSKEGDKKEKKTESIVREGIIDLKKIDKNKDGKVFQDFMHWNVISDEAGKCPLCKMTLEEVTIKVAKENLKKNGFKVK